MFFEPLQNMHRGSLTGNLLSKASRLHPETAVSFMFPKQVLHILSKALVLVPEIDQDDSISKRGKTYLLMSTAARVIVHILAHRL